MFKIYSMLERDLSKTLYNKLLQKDYRPVLVYGPRFCGKATLGAIFAKRFANTLAFDLSKIQEKKTLREILKNVSFFSDIYRIKGKIAGTGRTILILLNSHEEPRLLLNIAERRDRPQDLFILATAHSLPEALKIREHYQSLKLSPLSFKEFLGNTTSSETLSYYLEVPSPDHAYPLLMNHFHDYAVCGGMPEIVSAWHKDAPQEELDALYERVLSGWLRDIQHTAPGKRSGKMAAHILQESFPFAATRIKYHRFSNLPYGSRSVSAAFHLMEELGLARRIFPVTQTGIPAVAEPGRSPRLQFFDTGMMNYGSGIRQPVAESGDLSVLFKGQVLRHLTAQELIAEGEINNSPVHFWVRDKNQSTAEVDFAVPVGDLLIPVVIGPGEPGRLRSLHQFVDAAPHPYAVRLWANRLQIRQTVTIRGKRFFLLSLPYYLAARIPEHVESMMKIVKF